MIIVCSNEGPRIFQRGDTNKKFSSQEPLSQYQLNVAQNTFGEGNSVYSHEGPNFFQFQRNSNNTLTKLKN